MESKDPKGHRVEAPWSRAVTGSPEPAQKLGNTHIGKSMAGARGWGSSLGLSQAVRPWLRRQVQGSAKFYPTGTTGGGFNTYLP